MALNRQIERDLRPASKPRYGRLVVGVLASTMVGVAGVAFVHSNTHGREPAGLPIPLISQAYQQEQRALQQYETQTLEQQSERALPAVSGNPEPGG